MIKLGNCEFQEQFNNYVGYEVLTEANMNDTIFPDITPYTPKKGNRCFGGKFASIYKSACYLLQDVFLIG
jgi:hypothetical protein